MNWQEIRTKYPNQWLVVEALEAHTTPQGKRLVARFAVVEQCPDGSSAFKSYRLMRSAHPDREYYYLHTAREDLDIAEETWLGIRIPVAASVQP